MRPYPLVLLHGFTGSPASFAPLVEALETYDPKRVLAPALPGHEREAPQAPEVVDPSSNPFEQELAGVEARLFRAGVSKSVPAILVGYSLGARVGLSLALRHPHCFRHCVLVGVNPGMESASERQQRKRADAARVHRLRSGGLQDFIDHWEAEPLFESQRHLPASLLQEQARIRRSHTAEGLARSLESMGLAEMPNYWPRLAALQTPTTLVVGQRDHKFQRIAQRATTLLPRASLVVIPNVGHNVPLEATTALATLLDELPS